MAKIRPDKEGDGPFCPVILFTEFQRNLRVTACSLEALQQRVQVGMSLGEARALMLGSSPHQSRRSGLQPVFEQADPAADRAKLQALALHCQRYSPLVGLEDVSEPESFWIDISGSEELFGGEQGLVDTLRADLASQGVRVRVAIADTFGAAWAMSHFAESPVSIVPSQRQATALAQLPIVALRIPDAAVDALRSLDVVLIEQLMRLPRTSLPSRFGKELVRQLDQAIGLAPELLAVERLVEPIRVEWPFEEPVTDCPILDHVCEVLLERALTLIDSRRAGLRELTCCWLGTSSEPISLRLLKPTMDRRHLLELLRLRCERHQFTTAVTGIRMEVLEMGFPPLRQGTLFDNDENERHERALEELVDRLGSRLGNSAVLRADLQPDPLPEHSYRYHSWIDAGKVSSDTKLAASYSRCRPLRLLKTPQSLSVNSVSADGLPTRVNRSSVTQIGGPERIESGWWCGLDRKRDYYRLDLNNGSRLWAFQDRGNGQWFLHGLFS